MKEKTKWCRLQENGWSIVIPETDSKPHGFPDARCGKAKLSGHDCPCSPDIDWINRAILHHSFDDKETINKSLENPQIHAEEKKS